MAISHLANLLGGIISIPLDKDLQYEELETLVNRLELVEESMVFGLPAGDDDNEVKLSVKVVYNKEEVMEKYKGKEAEELYQIVWNQIKELNKTFPRYKHIQKLILTDEELIKTTTKKVKRQEEMKKILSTFKNSQFNDKIHLNLKNKRGNKNWKKKK